MCICGRFRGILLIYTFFEDVLLFVRVFRCASWRYIFLRGSLSAIQELSLVVLSLWLLWRN
jgi:hypothetical protein